VPDQIVLDASAIVAIAFDEPEAPQLAKCIAEATATLISAATYVEAAAVLCGRATNRVRALEQLDETLREWNTVIAPFDEEQARAAALARLRFGRGFGGSGGLNYGDTLAYALAKVRGAPLLFVGKDFRQTDIEAALA
jgi:ribonuclease VapC